MYRAIEASYPITFREGDATNLGQNLAHHNSVALIGLKRVGISNFLRFFLYHPDISKTYIHNSMAHVFIPVDLNDLVERDLSPFWTLVLTRLVDIVQTSKLPEDFKARSRRLFRESIQLKDVFFTLESIRKIVTELTMRRMYPTFFLIRFDRLGGAITPEFFANLQGLRDGAKGNLSYVFTSFRPLTQLAPHVFTKTNLSVFCKNLYMKPANTRDLKMILDTFESHYHTALQKETANKLLALSGGHVQYLQLLLIGLRDGPNDEEIDLQSEELFESLTKPEQDALSGVAAGKKVKEDAAPYLWATGMVNNGKIFSPILSDYLTKRHREKPGRAEFTKKEHLLFSYLKNHLGELCERYDIIAAVWPEEAELGISDWAIDRLVARVRVKLTAQKSPLKIVTVITRGYKLVNT